jgi:hypothetical protein
MTVWGRRYNVDTNQGLLSYLEEVLGPPHTMADLYRAYLFTVVRSTGERVGVAVSFKFQ